MIMSDCFFCVTQRSVERNVPERVTLKHRGGRHSTAPQSFPVSSKSFYLTIWKTQPIKCSTGKCSEMRLTWHVNVLIPNKCVPFLTFDLQSAQIQRNLVSKIKFLCVVVAFTAGRTVLLTAESLQLHQQTNYTLLLSGITSYTSHCTNNTFLNNVFS